MPRIPKIEPDNQCEKNNCQCDCDDKITNPVYVDSTIIDVKLKLLEEKLVPRDLISVFPNAEINEQSYIYVDNNGVPSKISLYNITSKKVMWDDLSNDIKIKILTGLNKQDKLSSSDHIIITEDNQIKLVLEAHDIGAITLDEAVVLISDQVALKIAELKPELEEALLAVMDQKLIAVEQRLDDKIVSETDKRIREAFENIDSIIDTKINTKLANMSIDGGLIRIEGDN